MTVEQRVVTDDEADIRLDRYLRRHIPGLTQAIVQKLCRTGQIRVDGKRVETSTRLTAGQAVRIPPVKAAPVAEKPAAPLEPELIRDALAMVLYRDDAVVVLD